MERAPQVPTILIKNSNKNEKSVDTKMKVHSWSHSLKNVGPLIGEYSFHVNGISGIHLYDPKTDCTDIVIPVWPV